MSAWQSENEEPTRSWPASFMANKLFSTRQPRHTYYSTAEPEFSWGKEVKAGSWVSEAALWTEWINRGRLVAEEHGQIYAIEANEFAGTLRNYREAFSLTTLYAQSMVAELRKKQVPSDLCLFVVELNELTPILLSVVAVSAQGLANTDGAFTGKSDPYCVCKVAGAVSKTVFTTSTISDCLDPVWNHEGFVSVSERQSLHFEVWDSDYGKDQFLGEVLLDPAIFLPAGFEGELLLNGGFNNGTLSVKVALVEGDAPAKRESSNISASSHHSNTKTWFKPLNVSTWTAKLSEAIR